MAFKVFNKTNYFYIINTVGNVIYEGHRKNVLVKRETTTATDFRFEGVKDWEPGKVVAFADIQTEAGIAYADIATFITYYEDNTGGGNSNA